MTTYTITERVNHILDGATVTLTVTCPCGVTLEKSTTEVGAEIWFARNVHPSAWGTYHVTHTTLRDAIHTHLDSCSGDAP